MSGGEYGEVAFEIVDHGPVTIAACWSAPLGQVSDRLSLEYAVLMAT